MKDIQRILARVNCFIDECQTDEEREEAFDYLLFVFKAQFSAESHIRLFSEVSPNPLSFNLLPTFYLDEHNEKHTFQSTSRQKIHLSPSVAVAAWR